MIPAAHIEAVLLSSPRPVSLQILLSVTGLSREEALPAIEDLKDRFAAESSGIVLREVAGGYQLATNPRCATSVERLREEARPAPLSAAAHEVLACVLYLGPSTRAAVSSVRGVNSDAVVRGLLERGLLTEKGRADDTPGAPALLDVSPGFLAAAGAKSRADFPPLEDLVDDTEISRVRERLSDVGPWRDA